MKREPSIHISESDLALVLQEVFNHFDIAPIHYPNTYEFAREVSKRAKTYGLSSRLIVVSNDKLMKKTDKVQLARRDNASMFAQQLTFIRRKLKHRGISLVKPGEKQWLEIKEICSLATEFCQEFQLKLVDGYREYCEIGIRLMKTYSVQRFKQLHSTIFNIYESRTEIEGDKYPEKTKLIYQHYLKRVNEKIGWAGNTYKDDPTKYVYFVRVRKEADEVGLPFATYIDAQFAGLEWANAIPDPTQLVGMKAVERLMKYCYENDITTKPKGQKKIDFAKIKQNGKKS